MTIEISCSSCGHRMRAPDTTAGKRVKCPKCQAIVNVPSAPTSAAGAGSNQWYVKLTGDGETYGPVGKPELDEWVAEGRITSQTQVLREGSERWQWASELYPQLQTPAGGPPAPSGPPAPGDSGLSSGLLAIETDSTSSGGISYRRRNYPSMLVASKMYYIFGWVMVVLGIVGVGGYLVTGLMTAVALFDASSPGAGIFTLLVTFLAVAAMALYTAIIVITLWFLSEAVKAMIDLEDNTHKTNHLLQQLLAQGQK